MAKGSRIILKGHEELISKLAKLSVRVQRKSLRKALRAGAKVVLPVAKAKAPVATGALRDSIKVRSAGRMKRGRVGMLVETSEGNFQGKTYYGGPVEYGYKKQPAYIAKDGRWVSHKRRTNAVGVRNMKAKPVAGKFFMRDATNETRDRASQKMADVLKAEIEKYI